MFAYVHYEIKVVLRSCTDSFGLSFFVESVFDANLFIWFGSCVKSYRAMVGLCTMHRAVLDLLD